MSSMHHHSSSSGGDTAARMEMTFFGSQSTPLFASSWTPSNTGSYAGTCIFLVILAIINRCLFAGKQILERKWTHRELHRKPIVVRGKPTGTTYISEREEMEPGTLIAAGGTEEHVKIITRQKQGPFPWRWSTDFPRACYVTVLAATTYLLMLAVMTLNYGYFFSVLGGTFLGELASGRYSQMEAQC